MSRFWPDSSKRNSLCTIPAHNVVWYLAYPRIRSLVSVQWLVMIGDGEPRNWISAQTKTGDLCMALCIFLLCSIGFPFWGKHFTRSRPQIHVVFNSKHSWKKEVVLHEWKWNWDGRKMEKKNGMKEKCSSAAPSYSCHSRKSFLFGWWSNYLSRAFIDHLGLGHFYVNLAWGLVNLISVHNSNYQDLYSRHLQFVLLLHTQPKCIWTGEVSTNNNSPESSTSNDHFCNHSWLFNSNQIIGNPNLISLATTCFRPEVVGKIDWSLTVCIFGSFLGPWIRNPFKVANIRQNTILLIWWGAGGLVIW